MYVACKGLPDLGNGPNQPTGTIIGEYSALCHHGELVFTLVRARISDSDSDKNLRLHFSQHITDAWHLPSVYVACKGVSDLGHGPNKPTATIIGESSASCHHGALVFTLIRARISDSDKNMAAFLTTHH